MDLPQAKCPHCGALNPEDSFFCGECGGQTRSLVTDTGRTLEPEPDTTLGGVPVSPADEPTPPPPPDPPRPLDVNAPGAGLAPPPENPAANPPPPAAYPGPEPQQQQYQQPYAPPADPYQGQGGGYPPSQYYGGGYGGYGMPADGNTSGMGGNYPAPPDASGWTFAGFIPWGLFGFLNGSTLWGVVGLLGGLFGGIPGLVYMIYMGVQGRELAWRNRRFLSVQEYVDTMSAWNRWGLIVLIISLGLGVLAFIAYILMFAALFATQGFP